MYHGQQKASYVLYCRAYSLRWHHPGGDSDSASSRYFHIHHTGMPWHSIRYSMPYLQLLIPKIQVNYSNNESIFPIWLCSTMEPVHMVTLGHEKIGHYSYKGGLIRNHTHIREMGGGLNHLTISFVRVYARNNQKNLPTISPRF